MVCTGEPRLFTVTSCGLYAPGPGTAWPESGLSAAARPRLCFSVTGSGDVERNSSGLYSPAGKWHRGKQCCCRLDACNWLWVQQGQLVLFKLADLQSLLLSALLMCLERGWLAPAVCSGDLADGPGAGCKHSYLALVHYCWVQGIPSCAANGHGVENKSQQQCPASTTASPWRTAVECSTAQLMLGALLCHC
jgi:hypothetical protein